MRPARVRQLLPAISSAVPPRRLSLVFSPPLQQLTATAGSFATRYRYRLPPTGNNSPSQPRRYSGWLRVRRTRPSSPRRSRRCCPSCRQRRLSHAVCVSSCRVSLSRPARVTPDGTAVSTTAGATGAEPLEATLLRCSSSSGLQPRYPNRSCADLSGSQVTGLRSTTRANLATAGRRASRPIPPEGGISQDGQAGCQGATRLLASLPSTYDQSMCSLRLTN